MTRPCNSAAKLPELARRHDIELLHGSELNIAADGSLDWDDDFLSGFDVLVASVHSDFDQSRDEMTRRLLTAIEHPYVNIIGHPTTRVLGRRPPVDFDVDAVFAAAARTHTALEINAFPDRLDLSDELVGRAREHGVVFAIDTDAHAVPHLDYIRYGVAVAQRGWVSADEVINTWPLDRLRGFLAKGRALSCDLDRRSAWAARTALAAPASSLAEVNLRVPLLPVFDDVNRGFLGRCCTAADTDVLSDQFCLGVFAKSLVRRDETAGSRAANLASLGKFGFALGFVGALLLGFVERGHRSAMPGPALPPRASGPCFQRARKRHVRTVARAASTPRRACRRCRGR